MSNYTWLAILATFAFFAANGYFGDVMTIVGYAILIGIGLSAGLSTFQALKRP